MTEFTKTLETIWRTYSGEAAWQTVADLSRLHRIQASPGYRQAAQLLLGWLTRDDIKAQILSYPADERTRFWAWPSFQEWSCTEASLHLIEPEESTLWADFRATPISLIQRSAAFEGDAEVIVLDNGLDPADYDGIQVEGKIVLTNAGDLRRVWKLAVKERGAIGILFDGMRVVPAVRPEGDLSDVRQYTSFWWQPGDVTCFGFVLTPNQGKALRKMVGEGTVRARAKVVSRLYDGELEVVSATIPGEIEKEVVVVAHLCHPQPSANDNASGAAAALEAVRTLKDLISRGELPSPRLTIRFLWLPEVTGSLAYLSDKETDLARMVAGINLDMVGEDQAQTGSSWLIERPPDAASSFAPELLVRLRDWLPSLPGMSDVSPSHTGAGTFPLYRQAETPFSGGSDHLVFSDPTVQVPMPMLIQWPDRFYHTSADTPDRTDPQSLARAGVLTAAYVYWLAVAGPDEVTWLGHDMVARFKTRLVETAQATVSGAMSMTDPQQLAETVYDLDRRLAYLVECQEEALNTLVRLAPVHCPVVALQEEVERAANRELAWARGFVELRAARLGVNDLPQPLSRIDGEEEQLAASLVPRRLVRGPVPVDSYLAQMDNAEQDAWRRLAKERDGYSQHTLLSLALYWADGERTILDIADMIEQEMGVQDLELLLAYFRILEKANLVSL